MGRLVLLLVAGVALALFGAYAAGLFDGPGAGPDEEPLPSLRERRPRASPEGDGGRAARPPTPPPREEGFDVRVLRPGEAAHVEGQPLPFETPLALKDRAPTGAALVEAVARIAPLRLESRADLEALRALEVEPFDSTTPPLLEAIEQWSRAGFDALPAGRALHLHRRPLPEAD